MADIQSTAESEFDIAWQFGKAGIAPFRCVNLPTPERRAQRQRVMAKTRQGKPSTTTPPEARKEPAGVQSTFYLRTKLLPPRPVPELLSRPRLAERLLTNLENPLTLVTANAGSGKTTFVADFLRTHKRQFVWYQLDHTDADPSVFLGYLTFGIQQVAPGFGKTMFAYLQEASAELARDPERAVDVLINEILELVDQKLIVVLDDYHHLGNETTVHVVMDRLLAYLPEVLHFVIVSREMPPLALARLRTHSPTALIERSDLLFTDEETRHLFRQVFDLELTPQQLAEYRERTHGWITALQLVRQVAQKTIAGRDADTGPADLIEILRQSERDIFDYFAEEVFAGESEAVRQLLMKIALLNRIELDACGVLFKGMNCARVLPGLVKRNVFLTVASDGHGEEYRLHPLFQGFLRRRLRSEIGRNGVSAAHLRYADYFLSRGVWEQGVRHLLAAEDYVRAAEVVAEKGAEWISSGALSSLTSVVDSLPASVIETYPRVLTHKAEAARLRGEYESAEVMFKRAAALLQQRNDREGEAETLHSLATLARRQGDFSVAFAHLDRALELVDDKSPLRMKCANTRGLAFVALGEWTAAELEFRKGLQLAQDSNDVRYMRLISHNLGLPAMMRGDFGEALRWLRRMLADGNEAPLPQEATARLNMAHCYLYLGDLTQCEGNLDEAIQRCQLFNLVAARADAFETYGNLFRERGEIEKANEYYQRAARAYDDAGINLARTELLEEQALLRMVIGDLVAARNQIDRLIAARPLETNEIGFFTASLTKGRILIAQGDLVAATDVLKQTLQYFHDHTLYYYEAQASLALASCHLKLGNEPQTLDHLRRAIDLAVRFDYEYWLKREVLAHPELFANEDAAELLPSDLRSHIANVTQPAPPALSVVETTLSAEPVVDLTINLLGPVEILREFGRSLAADAWTTRRARDILCFVASRRHRRASKDTIIDTFWGETDPDVVEKNFHPTVSHIRKALNSNQPLKQNFIIYRDGDYQLNPELSYRIDIEEFDRLVTRGESARRSRQFNECVEAYEKAVSMYRGDFVQGGYDPWVDEQRSYYKEQYLHLLETLAGFAQKQNEWTHSLQLAQQILHEDPFREDIHCLIMKAHVNLGNRGAAKEQYEALRRLLERELGVEPGPETRKTYRELLKRD